MTKGDETAFPARGVIEGMAWATEGMTKREMFAAMAMQGLANNMEWTWPETAENAVQAADALIEALNKEKP